MPPKLIDSGGSAAGRSANIVTGLALLALALGIWLRLAGLGTDGFWLDEVFSASFANLSAVGTLMAVVLYDVHPPLYYLQLNAWGLLGHGDLWLRLNSVLWSTGTLVAVFFGTRRQFGTSGGLLALMLCAVMGGEVYFAHELRMYPMETCLVVLSWIAANRFAADYRFGSAWPLIILLAAIGAIHSAAVIPASAVLLYVFPVADLGQLRTRLRTWIAVTAVVVCTYIPWVINSSLRNAIGHTSGASIPALIQTVGGWFIGYGDPVPLSTSGLAAFFLVVFGLVAALLACPRLLRMVLCFLVWPLLFGAILCVIVQPIWLDRTFAFCAPFVAIAFGAALGQWLGAHGSSAPKLALYAVVGLFAALLVAGGRLAYVQSITPNKPDHYRELAGYLSAHAAPGEVIYAPEYIDFWGVNRYLIGPDWGSALKFQDAGLLDGLKRWRRLYSLLGPVRLERLGVMPETRRIDRFRIPVYTGFTPLPDLPGVTGEWLVSTHGAPLSPPGDWHLCAAQYPVPMRFGRLELYHWACASAG
jgi:mannosyltransferase